MAVNAAGASTPPPPPGDTVGAGAAIAGALRLMGLAGESESVRLEPLAGGVSSDIFVADLARGRVCVKRALKRLKVAADWHAPVDRNRFEVAYLRFAAAVAPDAVPEVLAADDESLSFAMTWLDPDSHPVWKRLLRDGLADPAFASRVGAVLGAIHAASADRGDLARRFATDASFHALRLDPYLLAAARVHPGLAERLLALSERTARTRRVLVHGDVSPKNILAGPRGPVLLDAECAWFGDPAFDLAFCLNHLMLKCVWRPAHRRAYLRCFAAMRDAYLDSVRWEPADALETRAASLLPALMLARIDGKSPVEYLRAQVNHERVRTFAMERLVDPPGQLAAIAGAWLARLDADPPATED